MAPIARNSSRKPLTIKARKTLGVEGDFERRKLQGRLPAQKGPTADELINVQLELFRKAKSPADKSLFKVRLLSAIMFKVGQSNPKIKAELLRLGFNVETLKKEFRIV